MCEICGCGKPEGFSIHYPDDTHENEHPHENRHLHSQEKENTHEHGYDHEHQRRKVIDLDIDILAKNNITAGMNRRFFEGRRVLCLNMLSSPGSGKTTLLEKTITHFISLHNIYVIEGDQQTTIDADRIMKAGAPALQINTGSGCHLDANMIESALKKLDTAANSILFIENVGNLVCPSMFDLGEYKRVVIISVTEGEDKPLKYPHIFETSDLCIINKSDLLPYVDFRTDEFTRNGLRINHHLEFITVSAKTGEGMDKWYDWILNQHGLFLNS
jgi:hydrogenase nickel incorporation protein HypB